MRTLVIAVILVFILAACSDKEHSVTDTNENGVSHLSDVATSIHGTNNTSMTTSDYRLGVSSLGMSFSELLSHFSYDATEEVDGYLLVSRNGEQLFGLSDKNDLHDRIVWMITINSPSITTDGDIHVGMTVKELQKKFPNLSLNLDENDMEFFEPSELEKGTPQNPDARLLIYVNSKVGTSLAHDNSNSYPTRDFSSDGIISHILVLVTGNRPITNFQHPSTQNASSLIAK